MSHFISINMKNAMCRLAPIRTVTCAKCFKRRTVLENNVSRRPDLHQLGNFSRCQRLRYASTSVKKAGALQDLFPVRFIFVRTSVTLWVEYPDGLWFDVGYVDTNLRTDVSISKSKPVILGLPSNTGDHSELTDILMTFAKLGYRVVIPNLPGSSLCRGRAKGDEAVFTMSVKEKAEFVIDFLRELQIEKVDMLITNSCSVYTGVELCVIKHTLFRSLVMINPTGLEPTKSMMPVWVHKRLTKALDDRYILLKACVAVGKMLTQKRSWKTTNVITYTRTIAALSFANEELRAEYMRNRSIPCYAIFGETNDYLDVKSTVEYLSKLGITESAITELDEKGNIVKKGEPYNGNYGLHIQGTSEDIKKSGTVLLRKELVKILKNICPDL